MLEGPVIQWTMALNAWKASATSTSTDHTAVTYYEQGKVRVRRNALQQTPSRMVPERYGNARGRLCVRTPRKSMAKGGVTPDDINNASAGSSAAEIGTRP